MYLCREILKVNMRNEIFFEKDVGIEIFLINRVF
jgi:hypothetical protein